MDKKVLIGIGLGAIAVGVATYYVTRPTPKPKPQPAAEPPKVEKKRKKKPTETSAEETPSARPAEGATAKAPASPAVAKAAPASAPASAPAAKAAPAPAPSPKASPAAAPKASPASTSTPAPAPASTPAPVAAAPAAPVPARDQTFIIMVRGDIDGANEDVRTPLSEQGRRTIRDNVHALASHGITRIETSPHLACLQSAEEAAKTLGLAPGCIRVNAGLANLSGPGPKPTYPTPEEAAAAVPGGLVDTTHPWALEPARHPETTEDASTRFWLTFTALDKECTAENVLVITHDLALYRIAQHVRAKPTETVFGANAGDYIIARRGIRGASVEPWTCVAMSESITTMSFD